MNKDLTAYCGLCCADCIPSNEKFFQIVSRLEEMLDTLQFEHYAEHKSKRHPEFKNYPTFLSVLRQIKALRCPTSCRQGGGNPDCAVRQCVQNKALNGCWECSQRPGCPLLDGLRRVHPNLDRHLDIIKRMGPDKWFDNRREHYRWQNRKDAEPESAGDSPEARA